ncbi:MAG TPA: hypothetical protein VMT66_10205 [Steroidobacteraceae bacterium]|nr:hypothetical protein [Steroidobacteraceae bacterium]
MAGFVVQTALPGVAFSEPLKLVDLANCEIVRSYQSDHVRAGWARWHGSRQLYVRELNGGLLWLEGQPDRLPRSDEAVDEWLPGRTGSFRGFEIERLGTGSARVSAFVDPLGTRPIFVLERGEVTLLADKISTIVANASNLNCAWPALLEAAVLGSLNSPGTTVREVKQLSAGELFQVVGSRRTRTQMGSYDLSNAATPSPDAAERLGGALRTAVRETWINPDSHLLLSGGLDSRLVLGLSEGARKALTFEWYTEELPIARRVAEACGAELRFFPHCPEDYAPMYEQGHLVTGGMHQCRYVNNLGMAGAWRRLGVPAIAHAYLHNTVFRGWALDYWRRYPDDPRSLLAQYMGKKAHYIERYGHYAPSIRSGVIALLSDTGRDALRHQLRSLAETLEPVIFCGFDLTFEQFVLRQISRQIHFGIFLGWIEEIDVESPVFHHAPWRWYSSTHPTDRYADRVIQRLYQTLGRGLADIPDFGTGKPVRVVPAPPPQNWRNAFWFPAARAVRRRVRRILHGPPQPRPLPPGPDWDKAFRQPRVVEALQEGLAVISASALFKGDAVRSALAAHLSGSRPAHDVLWALAVAGQMGRLVADNAQGHRGVRVLPAPTAVGVMPNQG